MLNELKQILVDLDESKNAVETLVVQACDAFTQKGYDVVLCEPAGIGYYSPLFPENWVYDTSDKSEPRRIIPDREPVYVYQYALNDTTMSAAVRNSFEHVEYVISQKENRDAVFSLKKKDVAVIQQMTGADTICFNYVGGRIASTGAAVTSAALDFTLGLLLRSSAASGHNASVGSYFFCVSANTGETLWEHGKARGGLQPYSSDHTFSYKETFAEEVLRSFPDIGKPMDMNYLQESGMMNFIKTLLLPMTIND